MAAKVGGSKGGKFSLNQNADMNVTPFVDVMLVLLIIFMVSIPAATVSISSIPSPDAQRGRGCAPATIRSSRRPRRCRRCSDG